MRVTLIVLKAVRSLIDIAIDFMEGREQDPAQRVQAIWPSVQSEIARAQYEDQRDRTNAQ